jgi:hypothetical protein
MLLIFYSVFAGEFLLQEKRMKNGWWYALAPLSFWFTTFFAKSEPGLMNLMIKFFLGFIALFAGFFVMMVLYPLWWSGIVAVSLFYFSFLLFFSPFWFGTFNKVIKEMGNYRQKQNSCGLVRGYPFGLSGLSILFSSHYSRCCLSSMTKKP